MASKGERPKPPNPLLRGSGSKRRASQEARGSSPSTSAPPSKQQKVSSMSPAAAGPLTVITPNLTNPSRLRESSSPAHAASSSSSSAAPTATVSEYKPRNP